MSSNGSSGLYEIEPLSGAENYSIWKFRMGDILRAQGLWRYADGSEKIPDDTKPDEKKAWLQKDRFALSQIKQRVKGSVLVHVRGARTAAIAWSTLQATYEPKGALAIVMARRKLFRPQREENENIEEILRKLQEYRGELANLGAPIGDDEFNITILTALPERWDTFTSALDADILKDSARLIARIMEQDRLQKSRIRDGEAVLTAKRKANSRKPNPNQWETNQQETRECFYCKKKGHLQKDCRKRKREKGSEYINWGDL